MMFCDIHSLALLTYVIFATLAEVQLQVQESFNSDASNGERVESRFESEVLCSDAGNCTCMFEKSHVKVKCTSVGDNLDEIASKIPKRTTHL